MRWTSARHRQVLDTGTAEAAGRVDGMVFDPASSSIVGLVVGDRVIGWGDSGGIGVDAVTVSDAALIREPDSDLEHAGVAGVTNPISKRVFTEEGFEIGTVADLDLDATTGVVDHLVLGDDQVDGSRVIGVGSYAVVVTSTAEPAADATTEAEDLEGLTKVELYEMAKERELEGRSAMSKAELVEALRG